MTFLIIENCIFQIIVQSENLHCISSISVEHYAEMWKNSIWNSLLVTKYCYQYL